MFFRSLTVGQSQCQKLMRVLVAVAVVEVEEVATGVAVVVAALEVVDNIEVEVLY